MVEKRPKYLCLVNFQSPKPQNPEEMKYDDMK